MFLRPYLMVDSLFQHLRVEHFFEAESRKNIRKSDLSMSIILRSYIPVLEV